jgi:hypothetical protein
MSGDASRIRMPRTLSVAEDFVITSASKDIVSREAFKRWVIDFQSKIHDMDLRPSKASRTTMGAVSRPVGA